ncbi:MAG: helix-turn-helix domain-containing protein, partial [Planctomycetota bacterium]
PDAAAPPPTASATLKAVAMELLEDGTAENRHTVFLDLADKTLLLAALEVAQGNQSQAARLLGLSRQAVQMKMNKYSIQR